MAGYLGTKAVFLSTTAASVTGNSTITGSVTAGSATVSGDLTVDTNTLYVDSANNRIGIGTASPANGKLVVEDNGSNLYLKQTTGDYGYIIGQNDADGALTFSRRNGGNTEYMRISGDGYLYVNTSSNLGGNVGSAKLHVLNPNTQGHGVAFKTNSTSGFAAATFARNGNNGAVCEFFQNVSNGAVGRIDVTSSATSYVTSSDYRLKEDVQPMTGASERVLALNPVNFAWKVDGSRVDGFLAHEAQAVVPEAVTGTKDAMRTQDVYDEDGNITGTEEVPDYQGIDQSKLVPLLTAALQEALTEIADLKARVTALETV